MTIEEARKVMWLGNNYRPMGELFDEGHLTRRRLEWAIVKAYDLKIRQAAQVFLDLLDRQRSEKTRQNKPSEPVPVPLSMSIEEARTISWPFRPYEGYPMGDLVDAQQLSLKDLGYAIENAWDNRVRDAAMTMMLWRLNQVVESPVKTNGIAQIISGGRSFSERRQAENFIYMGAIPGLLIGGAIAVLFQQIFSGQVNSVINNATSSPSGVQGLLIAIMVMLVVLTPILLAGFVILNRITDRLIKQINKHRKGEEGEDRVVTIIGQVLDGNWYIFRNLTIPGRDKTDLDVVLVGPPGVWVLEVKNFTTEHRNIGEHWEYRAGNRWKLESASPSRQAKKNASVLSSFLKADSIQQWIEPTVVWANPDCPLTVENPIVPVWGLERLPDELGNIWGSKTIAEDKRQKIVAKLSSLCKKDENTR